MSTKTIDWSKPIRFRVAGYWHHKIHVVGISPLYPLHVVIQSGLTKSYYVVNKETGENISVLDNTSVRSSQEFSVENVPEKTIEYRVRCLTKRGRDNLTTTKWVDSSLQDALDSLQACIKNYDAVWIEEIVFEDGKVTKVNILNLTQGKS